MLYYKYYKNQLEYCLIHMKYNITNIMKKY